MEERISKLENNLSELRIDVATTCKDISYLKDEIKKLSERQDSLKNMYNDHLQQQVKIVHDDMQAKLERKNKIYLAILTGSITIVVVLLNTVLKNIG